MKIVVTGSSTGIGRALTENLLSKGHEVWGWARSDQSDLRRTQPEFRATRCDVAEWSQVENAANETIAAWGHVDGLVTCAGLQGEVGPTIEVDPLKWSATVRANLDGTFYAIRALADALKRAPRRGKIVCFSGGGATKARVNFSAYGVAKTAVVRLVENLAEELRGQPIDVNAVAPGAINTRLTDEVIRLGAQVAGEVEYAAAVKQKATGGASLQRALGLVEFLLSPSSDGLTGRLLSAPWDSWEKLAAQVEMVARSDVYQLRRIVPEDRGLSLG